MTAPSAMTSRGATMSPTTEPVGRRSTCSLALTFPVTAPLIVTFFATKSAVIVELGPMVKLWSPSSIDPTTWPSIVKSSALMTLPSTRTDLPIHAASRRSLSGALGSVASPGRTGSPVLSPFLIRSLRSGCQLAIADWWILLVYYSHENRQHATLGPVMVGVDGLAAAGVQDAGAEGGDAGGVVVPELIPNWRGFSSPEIASRSLLSSRFLGQFTPIKSGYPYHPTCPTWQTRRFAP